jgi:translation initiation factor IF-3
MTTAPEKNADNMVNDLIPFREMRVINPEGEMLGVLTKRDALEKASFYGLDLVCVSPNTSPVVCKIMDYGKHLYMMKKKAKEVKKKQTVIEVKELKIRPNTDTHDLMVKVRQGKEFLAEGCKIKLTVFFRGREAMFVDNALANINFIITELGGEEAMQIEKDTIIKNRRMTVMLSSKS